MTVKDANIYSSKAIRALEQLIDSQGNITTPTFTGLNLSGMTLGSVLFAGSGGLISQDNANLFWDNTNKYFGIGTPWPGTNLEIKVTNDLNAGIYLTRDTSGENIGIFFRAQDSSNQVMLRQQSLDNSLEIGTKYSLAQIRFFTQTDMAASASNERMRIDTVGNVGIGTTTFGAGGVKVLTLGNGTAPGALANTASIVALAGELYGVDAAGNQTLNSPHKAEILDQNITSPYPWVYYAKNLYLGKEVLLDWSLLVTEVERLSGKKFATYRDIPIAEKRDWKTDQQIWVDAKKERMIAEKMNEEVEVLEMDAVELVEMQKEIEVDTEKTETKYVFDAEIGRVKAEIMSILEKQKVGIGEFEKQLKDGIRLDEKTGKLFRKKTRVEVLPFVVVPSIPEIPKWMRDRGVL